MATLLLLLGHDVHEAARAALYVPAWQEAHVEPPEDEVPAVQPEQLNVAPEPDDA